MHVVRRAAKGSCRARLDDGDLRRHKMPELLVAHIWQLLKERRRQFSCCCPPDSALPPRFGADGWLIHNVVREHLHDSTDIVVIPGGHEAAHKRFAIKARGE